MEIHLGTNLVPSLYLLPRALRKDFFSEQNLVLDRLIYKIGNRQQISFWKDPWLLEESLACRFPVLFYPSLKKEAAVFDFLNEEADFWNLSLRKNLKDAEIDEWATFTHHLSSTKLTHTADFFLWNFEVM